jgi:hypothetical protein
MTEYDEVEIAELIRLLPPAPETWVAAAKELPRTRQELDRLLPMLERDAELRAALTGDLEAALQRAGFRPKPPLVAELRRQLARQGRHRG